METRCGSVISRWSETFLPTGHVIQGHCHNFHHMTVFLSGKWRVEARAKCFTEDGKPAVDKDGNQLWHQVRNQVILGGKPGAFLGIDAELWHRLTVEEGPGVYMCVYSHRIPTEGRTELETFRELYTHVLKFPEGKLARAYPDLSTRLCEEIAAQTGMRTADVEGIQREYIAKDVNGEVVPEYTGWREASH